MNDNQTLVSVIMSAYNSEETIKDSIESILNQYIKPAVEADGGAITFHSYIGDIVTVNLKGACSGCPSSTSTLKGGIENLLKQKIDPNIRVKANEK